MTKANPQEREILESKPSAKERIPAAAGQAGQPLTHLSRQKDLRQALQPAIIFFPVASWGAPCFSGPPAEFAVHVASRSHLAEHNVGALRLLLLLLLQMTPRFVRHFTMLCVPPPSDAATKTILSAIFNGFLNDFPTEFKVNTPEARILTKA